MDIKEEFAAKLNGREIGSEITGTEEKEAKKLGLIVVFGASDDLVEFRGHIYNEIGCYEGGTIKIHRNGILEDHDDCECEYCAYEKLASKCLSIQALWCDGSEFCWTFKTDIPHATFEILDEGDKYCRGLIIEVKSLPEIVL